MALRNTSIRFDPIDCLEAAYRLDLDRTAWLEELARASHPGMRADFGTQVCWYRRTPSSSQPVEIVDIGLHDAPQASRQFLQAVVAGMDAGHAEHMFSAPTRLSSFRELVPTDLAGYLGDLHAPALGRVRDFRAVIVQEQTNILICGALSSEIQRIPTSHRRRWQRIASHVSSALRLRVALAGEGDLPTEAVVTASGKIVHAEGSARGRSMRDRLRTAVVERERARSSLRRRDPTRALDLWRGLVAGRWTLVDRFESDGRRYVVACPNPRHAIQLVGLTERQSQVAELASHGQSNREIGYALGLAESSVAQHVAAVRSKLRLPNRSALIELRFARLEGKLLESPGLDLWVAASQERPPPDSLTDAERAVARLAAVGLTDGEIAGRRRTSKRTVANQLRQVFRKMGVHSRLELTVALFRTEA